MPRPRSSRGDLPLRTGDVASGPRDESREYTNDHEHKGIIDVTKRRQPYERSPIVRSRIHTRNIKTHTYIRARSVLAPFDAVPVVSLLPNEVIAMQPLHLHSGPNVQRRCCGESRIGRYLDAVVEIVGRRDRSQEVVDDSE